MLIDRHGELVLPIFPASRVSGDESGLRIEVRVDFYGVQEVEPGDEVRLDGGLVTAVDVDTVIPPSCPDGVGYFQVGNY